MPGPAVLGCDGIGDTVDGCADDRPEREPGHCPMGIRCRPDPVGDMGRSGGVVLSAPGSAMIPALIVGVLVVVLMMFG